MFHDIIGTAVLQGPMWFGIRRHLSCHVMSWPPSWVWSNQR